MKYLLAAVLCVGVMGCAHSGTVHKQHVDILDEDVWYFHDPNGPQNFEDGSADPRMQNVCGWVYKWDGNWEAAATPDIFHLTVRHYHTKQVAMGYVESWCKP